ncbi:MAG: phasin family protein [Pseudomonadota bacterium]
MTTRKQNGRTASYAAFETDPVAAMNKMLKGYDELVAVGKDNVDVMVQVNNAAVAGAKRLNTEITEQLKAAYEANVATAKAVASAKTVQEAVDLQAGHVRATLDTMVSKSTELSEVAIAVANEVAEPIQARAKATFDKMTTPVAA